MPGSLGAFELQWHSPGRGTQLAAFVRVLDLETAPAFSMHQPPQGYFHAAEGDALDTALAELPEMIGEFEKPKFFAYKESICAHSRSKKTGCNNCIDICSTRAISADGDKVKVDPHLCMGCGACATVCPSGAMSYQYPRVADRGAQLRAMLNAYRAAAAGAGAVAIAAPLILFHNATDGREALRKLAREGRGLPPQVLPIETWHVAAIGLDLLLGAFAYGAAGGQPVWPRRCGCRQMHPVPGLCRRLPGIGPDGRRRLSAPEIPRAQLRAVRPVRANLPGKSHHPGAAAAVDRCAQKRGGAQRIRALQLHFLRRGAGYAANDRQHAGQAGGPFHVRRPGKIEAPANVRRLPRGRYDVEQA